MSSNRRQENGSKGTSVRGDKRFLGESGSVCSSPNMNGLHGEAMTVNLMDLMEGPDVGETGSEANKSRSRQNHASQEKKRKEKTRMLIQQIRDMVTENEKPSAKQQPMNSILEKAVEYFAHLKRENHRLTMMDPDEIRASELKRLHEKVTALTAEKDKYLTLLTAAGISIDSDPSLLQQNLWKRNQEREWASKIQAAAMADNVSSPSTSANDEDNKKKKSGHWPRKNTVNTTLQTVKDVQSQIIQLQQQGVDISLGVGGMVGMNGQQINTGNQNGILFMSPNGSAVIRPNNVDLMASSVNTTSTANATTTTPAITMSQAQNTSTSQEPVSVSGTMQVTQSVYSAPIMSTAQNREGQHQVQAPFIGGQGMAPVGVMGNANIPLIPGGQAGTIINQQGQMIFVNEFGIPVGPSGVPALGQNKAEMPNISQASNQTEGAQTPQATQSVPSSQSNDTNTASIGSMPQGQMKSLNSGSFGNTPQANINPVNPSFPGQPSLVGLPGTPGLQQVNTVQPGGILTVGGSQMNQFPSALVLPNGQIIPVVTQPLVYPQQGNTVQSGLLIPANQPNTGMNKSAQSVPTTGINGQAMNNTQKSGGLLMTTDATIATNSKQTVTASSFSAVTSVSPSSVSTSNMGIVPHSQSGTGAGVNVHGTGISMSTIDTTSSTNQMQPTVSSINQPFTGLPTEQYSEKNVSNQNQLFVNQGQPQQLGTGLSQQSVSAGGDIVGQNPVQVPSTASTKTQVVLTMSQAPMLSAVGAQKGSISGNGLPTNTATMVPIITSQGTILITLPPGGQSGMVVDANGMPIFSTFPAAVNQTGQVSQVSIPPKKPIQRVIKPRPGDTVEEVPKKKVNKSKKKKSTSSSSTDILAQAAESIFSGEEVSQNLYSNNDDDNPLQIVEESASMQSDTLSKANKDVDDTHENKLQSEKTKLDAKEHKQNTGQDDNFNSQQDKQLSKQMKSPPYPSAVSEDQMKSPPKPKGSKGSTDTKPKQNKKSKSKSMEETIFPNLGSQTEDENVLSPPISVDKPKKKSKAKKDTASSQKKADDKPKGASSKKRRSNSGSGQESFPETITFSEHELSAVLDQVENMGQTLDEKSPEKIQSKKAVGETVDHEPPSKKRRKSLAKGKDNGPLQKKIAETSVQKNTNMDIFEFTSDSPSPPSAGLVINTEFDKDEQEQSPVKNFSPTKKSPTKPSKYTVFSGGKHKKGRDQLSDDNVLYDKMSKTSTSKTPSDAPSVSTEDNLFGTFFSNEKSAVNQTPEKIVARGSSENLNLLSDMALSRDSSDFVQATSNSVQPSGNALGHVNKGTCSARDVIKSTCSDTPIQNVFTSSAPSQHLHDHLKHLPQNNHRTPRRVAHSSAPESVPTGGAAIQSNRLQTGYTPSAPTAEVVKPPCSSSYSSQNQLNYSAESLFSSTTPENASAHSSKRSSVESVFSPDSSQFTSPNSGSYQMNRHNNRATQHSNQNNSNSNYQEREPRNMGFYSAENFVQTSDTPRRASNPSGHYLNQTNQSVYSPPNSDIRLSNPGIPTHESNSSAPPPQGTGPSSVQVSGNPQDSFSLPTFGLGPPAEGNNFYGASSSSQPGGTSTFTFSLTSSTATNTTSSNSGVMPHHQFPFYPIHPALRPENRPPFSQAQTFNSSATPSTDYPNFHDSSNTIKNSGSVEQNQRGSQPANLINSPPAQPYYSPPSSHTSRESRNQTPAMSQVPRPVHQEQQTNTGLHPHSAAFRLENMAQNHSVVQGIGPPQMPNAQGRTHTQSNQQLPGNTSAIGSSFPHQGFHEKPRSQSITSPPLHHTSNRPREGSQERQPPNHSANFPPVYSNMPNDFQSVANLSSTFDPPAIQYSKSEGQQLSQNRPLSTRNESGSKPTPNVSRTKKSVPQQKSQRSESVNRSSKTNKKAALDKPYEVDTNLSNSIFETGRSMTPYFPITSRPTSPPRNNDGPTYIPSNLFPGAPRSMPAQAVHHKNTEINPPFNPLFNPGRPGQNTLGLNFQHPPFGVNPVHSSNSQISAHNASVSVTPHMPNFNLSNIFGDLPNPGQTDSLNISPIKFSHNNTILPGQPPPMDHNVLQHHHQGPLYHNRSHPPAMLHNAMSINNLLSHNHHPGFEGRPPVGPGMNNPVAPPFHGHGHPGPPFGMPPLNFSMHDH